MLEKCEEATRGELDTRVVLTGLENDVRAFIQHEKEGNKQLMTSDPEVDGLVRIRLFLLHLLRHFIDPSAVPYCLVADAEGPAGAQDSPAGVGKGAGAVPRFLQALHSLSKGQIAQREPAPGGQRGGQR